MSRQSCFVADFLTIFSVTIISTNVGINAVFAQKPAFAVNRVESVSEDASGQSITITTVRHQPLTVPQIQYLPGPDGETIMVADFPRAGLQPGASHSQSYTIR